VQALQNSGFDAQAVRFSIVPSEGAAVPAPEAAPSAGGGVSAPGASAPGATPGVPIPAEPKGSGGSTGAIVGGVVGGLVFGVLLAALLWFWLARRRRRAKEERAAAGFAAGGKGDVESASDTGSSSGGSGGGGGAHPSCWPFNRRQARGGAGGGGQRGAESPGEMYGSTAFLPKGVKGSSKVGVFVLMTLHGVVVQCVASVDQPS